MNKNQKSKTVIVLGPPKSGTSMTTGILDIMGVHMGEEVIAGKQFDPKGYFEDKEFWDITSKIINKRNATWYEPKIIPVEGDDAEVLSRQIKTLMDGRVNKKLWGWKDPTTIFALEWYFPHLVNPHIIICSRNMHDIANSYKVRDGFTQKKGFEIAVKYYACIIEFLSKHSNIPHLFISYEDFMRSPGESSKQLANFLDIELTEEKKQRAINFVVPREYIDDIKASVLKERVVELNTRVEKLKDRETRYKLKFTELVQEYSEYSRTLNTRGWKIISSMHKIRKSIPWLKNL
jgi:hypothetical protein